MSCFLRSSVLALALISAHGCYSPPPEDAGDDAFVAYATTAVLGRRPHSVNEVYALSTLEGELGREAVLRVLMEQPEFVDYWSDVLMDDLLVWREGGERAGDQRCYTETHLDPSDHDDLVEHLRFRTWSTPFCPPDDGFSSKITKTTKTTTATYDPDTWLMDPDAPDDRTRDDIARDDLIQRYVDAGDVDALQAVLDDEAAGGGERVIAATAPVEPPISEGLYVGDDAFLGEATDIRPAFVKDSCDQRFTMADVLQASLSQDRLDVLYRASIATQGTFTTGNNPDRRAATQFTTSFLNRDLTCVSCHSSHYSTTSGTPRNMDWDRFEPAHRLALEGNVFSYTDNDGWHDGSLGGEGAYQKVVGLYDEGQWAEEGGIQPFGMDPVCGVFTGNLGNNNANDDIVRDGFLHPDDRGPTSGSLAGYEGAGVLEMLDMFQSGVHELDWYATEAAPGDDYGTPMSQSDFDAQCVACHNGSTAPTFQTNAYQMPPARIHQIVAEGPPTGGSMGARPDQAAAVTARFIQQSWYRPVSQYELPETALAHLTAMRIVDDVFEEVSGARLTTETGFPRNPASAEALQHLTRVFVDEGWSLRALLVEILTSTHINRVAPEGATLEGYPLPMVVEPFADVNELDEDVSVGLGDDANGQGDLVHRWSVRSLLRQVQHALDWPAPPIYPGAAANSYAQRSFQRDLGARMNRQDMGFWEHDLNASLAWELEIGTCRNTSAGADFIDELTDEGSGLSLAEAMLAVKERLVTAPEWWGAPESGGVALPGGTPTSELGLAGELASVGLAEPASSDPEAVRDFCAALLMSPQFLLAGLPVDVPNVDSFIPCDRGAVCTHDDYCEKYADTADRLGFGDADCSPYDDTIGWTSR